MVSRELRTRKGKNTKMAATFGILRLANRNMLLSPQLMTRPFVASGLVHRNRLQPAPTTQFHTSPRSLAAMASSHWNAERVLVLGMLGIFPLAYFVHNPAMDYCLATAVVLHGHWGFEQIVTDYIHGPLLPRLSKMALYGASILAFAGLCYFNYNDVGITKALSMIWHDL
ncbi:succinate dehydrogenase [ubiquinone] cytochrome b small subunit, mitochondrial-like [Branchiostoma floridae]|uniref:Succinate dehydrogenase [ubiquinone] cytochrome b small subunit n=2 Tax=Branchiostoma floridae TaxID=7739 RepID=A0A9J7KHF4_BRAFL|nr:succinate dehydrogenase [ubiquinone] cytochrome b small subunit, mitochondrial-like [Branchiostoma floridae]